MKKFTYTIASALLVSSVFATAQAGSTKSAFSVQDGELLTASDNTVGLGSAYIRAPGSKELVIDLAVQCGLHTVTTVKSSGGNKNTSVAEASVAVSISVVGDDGVAATVSPSSVIYCGREQTLSATLGGIIDDLDACTGIEVTEDCTLSDEEIALGLKTMNANAYNFFASLPSSQNYTVTATAVLDTCAGSAVEDDSTSPNFGGCLNGDVAGTWAEAYINGAAMDVQEVRF